jgi:hypothetical protein
LFDRVIQTYGDTAFGHHALIPDLPYAGRLPVPARQPICWYMSTSKDAGPAVTSAQPAATAETPEAPPHEQSKRPKEIGGPPGPEPTRYGDWQYKGRCTDF